MKIKILLSIIFSTILLSNSNAQPSIQWEKSLGGTGFDYAYSIRQTYDGGYIVAGSSASNDGDVTGNHGGEDVWVVKLNNFGSIDWQKSYGGTGRDIAHDILQTSDGGYIIAGTSNSNDGDVTNNHGNYDAWIIKISYSGVIEWERSYGAATDDEGANSICQTFNGGYCFAGKSQYSFYIVEITTLGNIISASYVGGNSLEEANSIIQIADSGYIVAGSTRSTNLTWFHGNSSSDNYDVVIYKKSNGTAWQSSWWKCYGGTGNDYSQSIKQTNDGGYILTGLTGSNDGDAEPGIHGTLWVLKLLSSGIIEWEKSLGAVTQTYGYSIDLTNDNGYIIAGKSIANGGDVTGNHGYNDYWVVKLNNDGDIQWQKSLGGSLYDEAFAVHQTNDNGYIIAGFSGSENGDVTNHHGNYDFWIVKLDEWSGINLNSISTELKAFPSPVSDVLTFETSKGMFIEEIIFTDIIGRKVYTLSNIQKSIGKTNIKNFSPGIYFASVLFSNGNIIVKKIIKE